MVGFPEKNLIIIKTPIHKKIKSIVTKTFFKDIAT